MSEQAPHETHEQVSERAPEVAPQRVSGSNPIVAWLEGVRQGRIPGGPL